MPSTRSMSDIRKMPPPRTRWDPTARKTTVLKDDPLSLSGLLDSAAAREQQLHVEAASPAKSIMQDAVIGELRDSESVVNSLIKDMATTAARAFLKDEPQELCVRVSAEDSNMPLQYWIGLMTDQHKQLVFKLDELVKDLEAMKTKCAYHDGLIEAQDGYREMHEGKLKQHGAYLKQFSNGMHNQLEQGLLMKERLEELEDKMVSLTGRAEYINCGFEDFDKRIKDVTARFDKLPDFGILDKLADTLAKFDTTTQHLLARMAIVEESQRLLGGPIALMDRVAKLEAHCKETEIFWEEWREEEWSEDKKLLGNVETRMCESEARHDATDSKIGKVAKWCNTFKEKLKNGECVQLCEVTPSSHLTRLSELEDTVAQLHGGVKAIEDRVSCIEGDLMNPQYIKKIDLRVRELENKGVDDVEKVENKLGHMIERVARVESKATALSARIDATLAVVQDHMHLAPEGDNPSLKVPRID